MIRIVVTTGVAAVLLAGCDKADSVDAPAATPTPLPMTVSSAVQARRDISAQTAPAGTLPMIFAGLWGPASGCAAGRTISVAPRDIGIGSARFAIGDVELQQPGVAVVTLTTPGKAPRIWQMHAAQDGGRLDVTEAGKPDSAYFRCGATR